MPDIALELDDGRHVVDVIAPFRPELPLAELVSDGLRAAGMAPPSSTVFRLARSGKVLPGTDPVGPLALRSGDRIEFGRPFTIGEGSLVLEVMNGAEAGTVFCVRAESLVIGRDPSCGLVLSDASVSRQHVRLMRSSAGIAVEDLGSANGTLVDGTRVSVRAVTNLGVGGVIEVGDVVLAVHESMRLPAHLQQSGVELVSNRPPRVSTPEPSVAFTFPRAPQAPRKRPFPLITIVVPLVVGVAMGILISPLYLLLGLASPLLAIGSVLEDRRSGRKTALEESQRWREDNERVTQQVLHAHSSWQELRRRSHPSAVSVAARSVALLPSVWEVRSSSKDFLETRAGLTELPSALKVVVSDQGDDALRKEMEQVAQSVRLDPSVPVVLDLATLGTVGIVGDEQERHELVSAQIIQLAGRHSPQDLQIVVLAPAMLSAWDWCKWIPHTLVEGSIAIAADEGEADSLFHALLELAEARHEASSGSLAAGPSLPHVVVVIEPPIPISPREAAQLCALGLSTSMSVFWLAAEPEQLPGACRAVIEPTRRSGKGLVGTVTFPDAGVRHEGVELDSCSPDFARRAARALAPLRDATSGGGGEGVPSRVNLVDLLSPKPTDVDSVMAGWAQSPSGIQAILGRGHRGPVRVDLRADGPHALVAGTTGSGKSELLQTWVASMAATYPPDRVTFVLIDYKGGAAFKDCIGLPHTVGFVTDLDPHTAERAMVSLDAELVRREHILATHGAKDLIDLETTNRPSAPPNLILIIDEFAALKAEMPEFVSGLVDIAQRGRSLGVHLVLATQKPGGVIDPKIQANTNLRIALRVANSGESNDVLGRPLAAAISRRTPGRAFVRIGETQMFEVQAGYVGAPFVSATTAPAAPRDPSVFALGRSRRPSASVTTLEPVDQVATDLQTIVGSCVEAASALRIPPPRKPWLDPLPPSITITQIVAPNSLTTNERTAASKATAIAEALKQIDSDVAEPHEVPRGVSAVIGLADEPALQRQVPFVLDLEVEGNVAVYGGPGVGKTTLLRTLGAQLASSYRPDRMHIYGLDFAGRGLACLEKLPHCGGVVTGDQLDKVRRLIEVLANAVASRQEELAKVGAGTIAELERATGRVTPALVVMIDGFAAFWQAVEPLDRSEHIQRLLRVAAEGRSVGVHLVYTADRRSAVTPALNGVTGARLVMNMPAPDEYGSLGFTKLARMATVLPRGRVAVREGLEFQVGVVSTSSADGVAQAEEITRLGNRLQQLYPERSVLSVEDLPIHVGIDDMHTYELVAPRCVAVGIDDQTRLPSVVDLASNPMFLVAGHDQSGKSTALETLTRGLMTTTPGLTSWFVSARRSPLAESAMWSRTAVGATAANEVLGELRALIESRARDIITATEPLVVVLDDADELTEGMAPMHLEAIVKSVRDANMILLVSMSTFRITRSFNVWVQQLRANRHGMVLRPEEEDGEVFNARLPKRTGLHLPAGRGYLFEKGAMRLTQTAISD